MIATRLRPRRAPRAAATAPGGLVFEGMVLKGLVLNVLLVPALLVSAPASAADAANAREKTDKGAPTAAPRAPQVVDVDPAADAAAAWTRFLAEAEFAPTYAAYDVLSALSYGSEGVNREACPAQREALRAALRAVPVSIALQRAALLCAEAEGDQAGAERAVAALAALSRLALSESTDGGAPRPIRVVQPWDTYALLHALGYEFQYEFHTSLYPKRYFPLQVAAWDPKREVERHLQFDYIDTVVAIDRASDNAGTPFLRDQMALAYARGNAENDDPIGHDVLFVTQGLEADSDKERLAAYRKGAALGGLQSARLWLGLCRAKPSPGCADGLVDALLPQAEKRRALGMTLLSMAYREGIGLKRDPKAADALLDAADARWHRKGASVYAALMLIGYDADAAALAPYLPRLRAAEQAGNAEAGYVLVLLRLFEQGARLQPQEIATLELPANNGQGDGFALLSEYYAGVQDQARAAAARSRAADAGHPASQRLQGVAALEGEGAQRDVARAKTWFALAAHGGDADAMRYMSWFAGQDGDWTRARAWLLTAIDRGDPDALLALADLFADQRPDVQGGPEDAARLYRLLSDNYDAAVARRRLARMAADGNGMERDPAQARRWLEPDAQAGDADSQRMLGVMLLRGDLGKPDPAAGVAWLERAVAAGDLEANNSFGDWLLRQDAFRQRARGLALLGDAERKGHFGSRNNLAWHLCVSAYDDVFDPAAGLTHAATLESNPDAAASVIDTVAACRAATGDFAGAATAQQRAIDMLPEAQRSRANDASGYFARLDLYRARKAYREE